MFFLYSTAHNHRALLCSLRFGHLSSIESVSTLECYLSILPDIWASMYLFLLFCSLVA